MFGTVIAISRLHTKANFSGSGFTIAKIFKQCTSQKIAQLNLGQLSVPARNFTSFRTFVSNNTCRKSFSQQIVAARSCILQRFKSTVQEVASSKVNPLRVNTKVLNNVMLYRFERPYLYKGALVFAIVSFIGCISMLDNIYYLMSKDIWNENVSLIDRLKRHVTHIGLFVTLLLAGPSIIYVVWYLTKRSIKYVVLHKGGDVATIVTYHPLKGERSFTVPLNEISCSAARSEKKSYAAIKVKGTKFHYMLDKSGHFVNPDLFDSSIGIKRFG